MPDVPLTARTALVTGASRGIGRAIAAVLSQAGAAVAINYHEQQAEAESLRQERAADGARAIVVRADVTRAADVARMTREIEDALGGVDILVNNAGISIGADIDRVTEGDWDHTLVTNLKSAFLVSQAVVPAMRARRWGRLVFISSVAAHVGGIVGPHYATSKAGMHGLMRYYAAHLAKEGITAQFLLLVGKPSQF